MVTKRSILPELSVLGVNTSYLASGFTHTSDMMVEIIPRMSIKFVAESRKWKLQAVDVVLTAWQNFGVAKTEPREWIKTCFMLYSLLFL